MVGAGEWRLMVEDSSRLEARVWARAGDAGQSTGGPHPTRPNLTSRVRPLLT